MMIGHALDNQGNSINIWHQENLNMCRALSLFLKVYAETIDEGFSNSVPFHNDNSRMVWAELNGIVVGGICYEYKQSLNMGWIVLSFTDPQYRGRGINKILHEYMENDIKKLGGYRVCSYVSINNEKRLKAAEKVGLKPQFYRMQKLL
jgi:GNAT superfamily N-acetyltransferase